jgi:3-oxoadipate enol-lactonase
MIENIKKFKGCQVELEYLLTGEENDETIVFVHGAGANLRQFINQHRFFSKDYKVLSVSLRGHGESGNPVDLSTESFSMTNHRNDLLEILDSLKINSFHYVGNSAGGLVGYEVMDTNPQLFKSFVTFGTTAELRFSKFVTSLIAGIDKVMMKINSTGYCRFVSKNASKYEDAQTEIYNELMMVSREGIPYFRKNLGNYSYIGVVEKMDIPFLLIQGEFDSDINRSLKSTIAAIEKNKKGSIIKLEGAGHFANLDKPQDFNKIIGDFIVDSYKQ